MNEVVINNKVIGENLSVFVIAEAGVNHNNDLEKGIKLIETAHEAGADAIKFQTYKAESITTKTAPRYWSNKLNDSDGTQYDTFSKLDGLSIDGHKVLKKRCEELGITFLSTPFNLEDVDILEEINVDVYKISSSDLTYIQLIKRVAETGKPVILSTGCATIGEMEKAVETIYSTGNKGIILQHCILQYPCDIENTNLNKMLKIKDIFPEIPVGYSDHTIGFIAPVTAVAMGAKTIEKHYTIDKKLPDSPDHRLSADPQELKEMVDLIRSAEMAKGYFKNGYYPAEEKAYMYARKSVVSNVHIKKGTIITPEMLTCKRPGTGIAPENMDLVVGSVASVDIDDDIVLSRSMLC